MTSTSSQTDAVGPGHEGKSPPLPASLPRPRKRLGQHFLTDRNILRRIVDATGIGADSTVLEVGAGRGDLTAELARRAGIVVAVELDDALVELLRRRFEGSNVRVVHADVLARSPAELLSAGGAAPPYVVVGNLPFNIASAVIRHFLEGDVRPERLVVTVQREVAENMTAGPGAMTLLSVAVQAYGRPRRLFTIPPGAFHPRPKVYSTVVRIDVDPEPRVGLPRDYMTEFFHVARAGFAAPRKRVRNSLALGLGVSPAEAEALLRTAGVDPSRRPGDLALEEWAALTRAWLERQP
ncbi:MAG TPA: 16S rRNA (adenine(1518)-N(6)/adenine(1519)-N(6))-dimethyltransferase RsmA [Dehalococcoidia bacterium]|nr:16S rRNA (adenine(1518)-N(6)/adenine(1519)-N(6))-dimethyltransferase RsmA [Dehalococcoidia bacterium]